MYKDKDKQREADRERQRRYRAWKASGGVTNSGCDKQGVTQGVTGNGTCVTPEYPQVSDQEFTKLMAQAGPGHVRVSKPSDDDYVPQCETTKAFIDGKPTSTPSRSDTNER